MYHFFVFDFAVPSNAKTKHYKCLELNGIIHLWYHAEGEEPSWYPPDVKDIQAGKMKYHGKTDHVVNAHIEVGYAMERQKGKYVTYPSSTSMALPPKFHVGASAVKFLDNDRL